MPSKYSVSILLVFFCLVFSFDGNAQRRKRSTLLDAVSVAPRAGVTLFFGDLVDESRTSYTYGANLEKEWKRYLAWRAQLMTGRMTGDQIYPGETEPYAYFQNFYVDFGVGAKFKPLDLIFGYYKQRTFKPYILAQAGLIYYTAKEWYGPFGYEPNTLRHQKSGIAPQATAGLGLDYWISNRYSVNLEWNGTLPFTDLLDGHENWVSNDPNTGEMITHDTESWDFYYTFTVGMRYVINDTRWINEPKYNRKAYLKTRGQYKISSKNRRIIKRRQKNRK